MKNLLVIIFALTAIAVSAQRRGNLHESPRVKVGLNYYSFNTPLSRGAETIESVIDFASETGFDGVDVTGYYFKGYPAVPTDERIFEVKTHAFHTGMNICGTGVRNDFTIPDAAKRAEQVQLVKDWIVVAAKLGAPTIRIFAGPAKPDGYSWDETARWIAAAVDECARFAADYGVTVALQNHDDFLKTADDVLRIFDMIAEPNVGLMLDVGCYRQGDPYRQIERTVHLAVNWQIKESVFVDGVETPTDVARIMDIIKESGYRGFVPIEILGAGSERRRTEAMFHQVKSAL